MVVAIANALIYFAVICNYIKHSFKLILINISVPTFVYIVSCLCVFCGGGGVHYAIKITLALRQIESGQVEYTCLFENIMDCITLNTAFIRSYFNKLFQQGHGVICHAIKKLF